MSDQLRALSDEIKTRGSMLRTTAQAWLCRHYKMSASDAKSMIGSGSGKFFEAREDALFSVKQNPTSCKCKKLEGVAASSEAKNPTREKRNPDVATETTTVTKTVSTKGAATKKAPKRKSGGRKSAPPSTQERSPMAAKKKTAKAKKAPKKRRTQAQKDATKKMLAANRAKRATKKAPKARKARKATKARRKAKHIKTWGERLAAKKPAKRRRRRTAAPKVATAPKRRRRRRTSAAATKRRTVARRRTAPRTSRATSSTTRKVRRVGNKLRTDIHTTRTTSIPRGKRNPVNDASHMTVGIIAIAAGFGTAEILDRFTVTYAPKDKDGKPLKNTDGKDMTRFVGPTALLMRHSTPDWKRFAVSGGGAAVLGGSAFLLRKHSAWGTTILGGLAIGFGFKLAALGLGYVLPKVLPVKSATEDSWVNEIFPENNPAFDLGQSSQAPLLAAANRITPGAVPAVDGAGKPGDGLTSGARGAPPWRRQGSASAASFGPVAGAGNMGRAPCNTCGGEAGGCKCPKGRAPQASSAAIGNVVEIPTAANAGNTGNAPKSLASLFGKEG